METELYRHFDAEGNLLYVGVSLNTVRRLSEHMGKSSWASKIVKTTVKRYKSRDGALAAEKIAVMAELPMYNTQLVVTPDIPDLPDGFENSFMLHDGSPVLVVLMHDLEGDAFGLMFGWGRDVQIASPDLLNIKLSTDGLLEICHWKDRAHKWFTTWEKTVHHKAWLRLVE